MTPFQGAASGASAASTAVVGYGTLTGGTAAAGLAFAATGIGIAIIGVAALLAALGATKGKTQHLNFDEAKRVALQFAESLGHKMEANYSESTGLAIGRELASRMVQYLEGHYLNRGSSSWQTWIGNCIDDLRNRATGVSKSDITSVIYLYGIYVGQNYDASRPAEFAEVISHDLTLFFESIDATFPQWGLGAYLWPEVTDLAAAKANQSYLEQKIGIDTGAIASGITPRTTAAAPAGSAPASSSQSGTGGVLVALGLMGLLIKFASSKN